MSYSTVRRYKTVRHYKGFEIHQTGSEWIVRWRDEGGNACSLAPPYPSIASAKRAINDKIQRGVARKRIKP